MVKRFMLGQLVRMTNVTNRMVYGWAHIPSGAPEEAIEIADGQASVIAGPVHINDLIGSVYQLATASGPIWVPAGMINMIAAP
jgi:hypothetical protein